MNIRAVFIILGLLGGQVAAPALAGVVILDNHTAGKVAFTIRQPGEKEKQQTLAAGDLTSISTSGPVEIAFDADGRQRRGVLRLNSIYYFVDREKKLDLIALALPTLGDEELNDAKARLMGTPPALQPLCTIPVEILVDDAEPTVQAVWEKRLRGRFTAASAIFERLCRVRFEVAAVDKWASNQNIREFGKSLAEFERKVQPKAGRLAIGFTGRYKWAQGEAHAGEIRGPLRSHILIRNELGTSPSRSGWSFSYTNWDITSAPYTSPTKTPSCVQRSATGEPGLAVFASASMHPTRWRCTCWARSFGPVRFPACSILRRTKAQLRRVYGLLAKSLPDNPAAPKYMALLDYPPPPENRRDGPRD